MSYTTLPDTGLRITIGYGEDDLLAIDVFDWQRMANTLLKLSALLDVDVAGIANGNILKYNSATTNWEDATPDWMGFSTTTTTSTTSTTSTTTTL